MLPETVFVIIALIISIVLHELAHGYMANWLGDPTARLAGRLSPNPLLHIDPMGSVVIPGLLLLSGSGFLFGWAKPVPYNPYNLRDQKYGEAKVAVAGPLTNLGLALLFAALARAAEVLDLSHSFISIAHYVVFINILLAIFNLIPFPPLDGSKVIMPFLPFSWSLRYQALARWAENNGLLVTFAFIFLFIYFFADPFFGFIDSITRLLVGF